MTPTLKVVLMHSIVSEVIKHPCIWNILDPSYADEACTKVAWAHVACAIGMASGSEASRHWQQIRKVAELDYEFSSVSL